MKSILLFSLVVMFFESCSMGKKIIRFYDQKKHLIDSIVGSSKTLIERYRTTKATFGYTKDVGRIQCNFFVDGSNKAIGLLADPRSYALEPFLNDFTPEKEIFELLKNDMDIVSFLQNYMRCKARAIKLTNQGIFFVISNPLYTKHPDNEGGLYVSFSSNILNKESKKLLQMHIYWMAAFSSVKTKYEMRMIF